MIEITEKWVGQSAGGRVFKEARALVKLGKITQVKQSGHVFQGMMQSGGKPMRVVVKVHGQNEVENLCRCSMSQATGAMCEHAAAVLLASITQPEELSEKKIAPENPEPDVQVYPLEVRLSPKFPYEGVRAIHLRRAGSVEEVLQADLILALWLQKHTGQVDAAMLSLQKNQLGGFFQAVVGHPRVFSGQQPIKIEAATFRPHLEMEINEESGGDTVWLRLADLEMGEMIALGNCLAQWNEGCLSLSTSNYIVESLKGLTTFPDLLSGNWLEVDVYKFVKKLEEIEQFFILPVGCGGLEVCEGSPEIKLEIAGSTRALQARLTAQYTADINVCLGISSDNADFPCRDPEVSNRWFVRNSESEQMAISRLMNHGFEILDASGLLFLRGEDEVLDFLTIALPGLRKDWSVVTEEKLERVESRLERIVPSFEISETHSGEDWLACDVAWQCGERTLDANAIRKLLQSGGRSVSLPGGGKAVISSFDTEVMEGVLLDANPEQRGGQYFFPNEQKAYIKHLNRYYRSDDSLPEEVMDIPELPDGLVQTLRNYQKEGVEWLYRRAMEGGAALLADDMGLGKTLQTLSFIKLWKEKGTALVVCPATLLSNWSDEAAKFVPDLKVLVMHGSKRSKYFDVMGSADIIITSYTLLDRDVKKYQTLELGVMVLDEASVIRNPDTLAAKAVRKMKSKARVAISGTPVENSVRDLWSIYQFLMPGYLGGREDFHQRYEIPCAAEVQDQSTRAAMQRLRWRTEPFMLRRTKSTVAKDLPEKIESIVWCEPSDLQKESYEAILRQGAEKVDQLRKKSGAGSARMQMLTVLLRLRQACCDLRLLDDSLNGKSLSDISVKLMRLMSLLAEAQRGGHRVLVFSQFTTMLALIRSELESEGLDFCYLDGATRDRAGEVERFQNTDGPPVFLISLKAGGYGLTLTAADTVVLFDPWWNPAVEAQAADRVHRIGQTKPATIYKLITRGTVEEKILRLQERKRGMINAAMGESDDESRPMMNGLSENEMLELFG